MSMSMHHHAGAVPAGAQTSTLPALRGWQYLSRRFLGGESCRSNLRGLMEGERDRLSLLLRIVGDTSLRFFSLCTQQFAWR